VSGKRRVGIRLREGGCKIRFLAKDQGGGFLGEWNMDSVVRVEIFDAVVV